MSTQDEARGSGGRQGAPHAEPHSVSTQDSNASRSWLSSQLADGLDDIRQLLQVASSRQVSAGLQQDAPRHVSHAAMPVLNGSEHVGALDPLPAPVLELCPPPGPVPMPLPEPVVLPEPVPEPGASHADPHSSSKHETKAAYAASLPQVADGVDDRQVLQTASSRQACAWAQHESPRQESHATRPVLNGSEQAGALEPLPMVVPEPLPMLVPLPTLVEVVPEPLPEPASHADTQSSS